jgi:hypothetical protein
MKTIKTMLMFCGIALSLSTMAQDGPRQPMPVPDRVARTIERLKPELNLTEPQVKDLNPVYTEFYTEMDKLRAAGQPPSPEARQKLTDDRDVKLKKILSEEQFKKLKELEEQMRQQRRPNG